MTGAYVVRETGGSVTISAAAQQEVVRRAVERVGGARLHRRRRGLDVELADGRARVQLELTAPLGVALPELARQVQASVAEALRHMCEVEVDAVDVSVEDLDP